MVRIALLELSGHGETEVECGLASWGEMHDFVLADGLGEWRRHAWETGAGIVLAFEAVGDPIGAALVESILACDEDDEPTLKRLDKAVLDHFDVAESTILSWLQANADTLP